MLREGFDVVVTDDDGMAGVGVRSRLQSRSPRHKVCDPIEMLGGVERPGIEHLAECLGNVAGNDWP
jgi:hypothetical protein